MTGITAAGICRSLVLGAVVALTVGSSASAQVMDMQPEGEPFSMEGRSLMQDDTMTSDPGGELPNQPLGEIGGVEIESDPNAPQEANDIMDDADNTGMPPTAD